LPSIAKNIIQKVNKNEKCDKSTSEMTNINTQTNLQQTNVNSKSSCCTVDEHMVNKYLPIMLSKDDVKNKNVSIHRCMSGTNISNCVSKFDQNKISPSKPKAKRIRKLPVRSRHELFYNVCTQKSMLLKLLPLVAMIYVTVTVNPVEYK
jgi:poly-D-alanine transfer protein DltD